MRTGLWIALVLLSAILVAGVAAENRISAVAAQYIGAAEELSILTEDGAWDRAQAALEAYQERWEQEEKTLKLMAKHTLLDEIAMAMDRLGIAVNQQDESLCALSCEEIKRNAVLLRDKETLSWSNLL